MVCGASTDTPLFSIKVCVVGDGVDVFTAAAMCVFVMLH